MLPEFLNDPDRLEIVAFALIAAVVVVGYLVIRFVQRWVWRVTLLLLLAGIAGAVWIQRDNLSECGQQCECQFFGIDVTVPSPGQTRCGSIR